MTLLFSIVSKMLFWETACLPLIFFLLWFHYKYKNFLRCPRVSLSTEMQDLKNVIDLPERMDAILQ
jgi:hypothetical protein